MQCMKCGRDCEAGEVFCPDCHVDMEKYPVKPGTVVLLPHYVRTAPLVKKPVKKTVPIDEQLRHLKSQNRILVCLMALFLVLAICFAWLSGALYTEYNAKHLPGQNYSAKSTEPSDFQPEATPGAAVNIE